LWSSEIDKANEAHYNARVLQTVLELGMVGEFFLVGFILILIMGGIYVFRVMPQQRDFVKRQTMARSLVEGDEIITGGGVVGKIRRMDTAAGVAYVEIADGIEIRVLTAAILDRYDPVEVTKNANMGQQDLSTREA
jgi:preprotein translocase YajC subunit